MHCQQQGFQVHPDVHVGIILLSLCYARSAPLLRITHDGATAVRGMTTPLVTSRFSIVNVLGEVACIESIHVKAISGAAGFNRLLSAYFATPLSSIHPPAFSSP